MTWYNPTEGTWVVSGEFATSSILAGSGVWIEDAKGSGNLLITYTASGAKVFSSGVLQFSTLMAPAGVVTLSNKGTLGSVKYHPRAFTDAEAIALATGDITVSFTLRNLLNNSPQGVWYDPSDTTTLFQDSAGTTPVTASGQPVGLMLDKSKGLVRGPELVVNGGFDDGLAGWTAYKGASDPAVAVEAGKLRLVVTTAYAGAGIPFSTAVGSSYELHLEQSGDSGQLLVGTAINSGSVVNTVALGMYRRVFVATTTTTWVSVSRGAVGTAYFDNISVRELPGNHATQPTAGSRPIYRRGDSRGVVNLLLRSEDFSNAVWGKSGVSVSANAAAAPNLTNTATRITSADANSLLYASFAAAAGASYTFSLYVKSDSVGVGLDLRLYSFGLTYTFGISSFTTTGDWQRVTVTGASPTTQMAFVVLGGNSTFSTGEALLIYGAQLDTGPTALPYQRNDSKLGGVATGASTDLHWLETDGVDDGMATGNIDFTGTDKVAVFAGVRKLSDAARAMLLELSAAGSAGSFAINAPVSTDSGFSFVSTGSAPAAIATLATAPSPISAVLSCVGDIAADTCSLFVDGQLAASSSADQGTGNFGNRPLYLFRRGGTILPFNGWFYGLAITGRLATDAETVATERFLAAKSAVVIP